MVGAGLVVAALALVAELSLILAQRYLVSPGISGRYRKARSAATAPDGSAVGVELAGV
jgi:osmoprotectant transport system permease protein